MIQDSRNDPEFQIEQEFQIEEELSFTKIHVRVTRIGNDYNLMIRGGESPHIGCTVLSVPRLSLTGDGTMSCTSSVINVTGHKDEVICRRLAEKVASWKRAVAVCSGGVHMEHITPEQIQEIEHSIERFADKIAERI